MWRHGLLLRCRLSFHMLKPPTVSLVKENSYHSRVLYERNVRTRYPSRPTLAVRNYSKVASVVQPDSHLEEVKTSGETSGEIGPRPRHFDESNSQLKEEESHSEDQVGKNDVKDILRDMTVEKTDTAVDDVCLTPRTSRPRPRSIPSSRRRHEFNDENTNKPEDTFNQHGDDEGGQRIQKTYHDQEQILLEAVKSNVEHTSDQWEELRNKILNAGSGLNEHNIDATVIGFCMSQKSFKTGLSYINYLKSSGRELNVATISKFLKLSFICSCEINDEVQSLITSLYDSLRTKYPVLDASTAENVLHGLCVTKRWKEGFDILDEIRLTCSPNTPTYSALVKASFDNDNPDTGWDLISRMNEDKRKPMPYVYESWLQYCKRAAAGDKKKEQHLVEKLLYFLASNDIRLTEEIIIMLRLWFEYDAPEEADWNVEFTTVDTRGMCKSCHQYLRSISVTQKEFEALRSAFVDKIIVGSNVFLKSTPEELEEYQKFIQKTAPFDVVIDGLNVAYLAGSGKGNPRQYAKMLQTVVQHFVDKSQKVLVLGRRHMYKWTQEYMDYIYENAEVFLTQNISQDDPYLLYAAMCSGLGTHFISRDLMRSHSFLLKDPKLHSCFVRWQKQHQYHILYVGDNGHVRFRPPQKIDTSAQRNRNGSWHIPYDLDKDSARNPNFNTPRQWLCLSNFGNRGYNDEYVSHQSNFGNRGYNDEHVSHQFRNSTREQRGHSDVNESPQFRKGMNRDFDDSDEENVSRGYGKGNMPFRGLDNSSKPRYRDHRQVAMETFDFDDDDDEESMLYVKNSRRRVTVSNFSNATSSELRRGGNVAVHQKLQSDTNSVKFSAKESLDKPYEQSISDNLSEDKVNPQVPPLSTIPEDIDLNNESDKQSLGSKQLAAEVKHMTDCLEDEPKLPSKKTRKKSVKNEYD